MFDTHNITNVVPEGIDPAVLNREMPIDCFGVVTNLITSPMMAELTLRQGNHIAHGGIAAHGRATDAVTLDRLDSRLKMRGELFSDAVKRFADPMDEIHQNFAGLSISLWHTDSDEKISTGIVNLLVRDELGRYRFSIAQVEESPKGRQEIPAFYTADPFNVGFALQNLYMRALASPRPAMVLQNHEDFTFGLPKGRVAC